MTDSQRAAYNAHRRELYHKQGEAARKRRRERERSRYHSLEGEQKRDRNARRAKLERDRYNKLTKEELELRNARRRERAKQKKLAAANGGNSSSIGSVGGGNSKSEGYVTSGGGGMHVSTVESGVGKMGYGEGQVRSDQHHQGMVSEDAIADAVSAAAEVAERAIGSIMDDSAVTGVMDSVPDGENGAVEI